MRCNDLHLMEQEGMTTPALYRYFESRDALITELIIEAYQTLTISLEQADAATPSDDYAVRFQALARAYRNWSVAHPHEYALIYGTPIPGYHAPRERTVPVAARIPLAFGMLFKAAWEAGCLRIPAAYTTMSPELRATAVQLMSDLSRDVQAPEVLLTTPLRAACSTALFGLSCMAISHQVSQSSGEFYNLEVSAISARLGLGG